MRYDSSSARMMRVCREGTFLRFLILRFWGETRKINHTHSNFRYYGWKLPLDSKPVLPNCCYSEYLVTNKSILSHSYVPKSTIPKPAPPLRLLYWYRFQNVFLKRRRYKRKHSFRDYSLILECCSLLLTSIINHHHYHIIIITPRSFKTLIINRANCDTLTLQCARTGSAEAQTVRYVANQ